MANFQASSTSGVAPITINFTDQSTGDISSWKWDFGDGQTSTAKNPSHLYSQAKRYSVTLTVYGPGGSNTKTKSSYITVDQIVEIGPLNAKAIWPFRTFGDCEFDGHGPSVNVSALLFTKFSGQSVWIDLRMFAKETTSNWSTASGGDDALLYNAPSEFMVKQFLSESYATWSYTDTDHRYDYSPAFTLGRFKVKGDTPGDDICNTTLDDTHMYFYDIRFKIRVGPK